MSKNEGTGSFADLFESVPGQVAVRRVKVGQVLDLEVVRIGADAVLVALDGKHEGIIELPELTDKDGKVTVTVGSRVAARVVDIERGTGLVRLSPVSAAPIVQSLTGGAPAKAAHGASVVAGMRVKGKVTTVERYGVFVEFEVAGSEKRQRGLVPVRDLGAPRGADLRKMFPLGTEIEAAVSALDERGRISLSVVALKAAEERRDFETYSSAGQGNDKTKDTGKRVTSFGTLGDLLKKK